MVENEYRERVIMLCSKVINGREKVEHHLPTHTHPHPLQFLPSDAEMVVAMSNHPGKREGERGKFRDQLVRGREDTE